MSDVIICGAGIAGVSAAYHLAVKHGIGDILLVDDLSDEPLEDFIQRQFPNQRLGVINECIGHAIAVSINILIWNRLCVLRDIR